MPSRKCREKKALRHHNRMLEHIRIKEEIREEMGIQSSIPPVVGSNLPFEVPELGAGVRPPSLPGMVDVSDNDVEESTDTEVGQCSVWIIFMKYNNYIFSYIDHLLLWSGA